MYTPLETSNHNTLDFLVYVVKYIVSPFARRILSAVIIQPLESSATRIQDFLKVIMK